MVFFENSVLSTKKSALYIGLLFTVGLILILFAGFRPPGIDNDSLAYIKQLNRTCDNISYHNLIRFEPSFWLLQQINLSLFKGQSLSFFLMYAAIAISIKFYAIYKESPWVVLSIFTYISFHFIYYEMTQIRAGVAIGFVFWSFLDVINRRPKTFIIKIAVAFFFHYSAFPFFLLYFLSSRLTKNNFILDMGLPIVGLLIMHFEIVKYLIPYLINYIPEIFSKKIIGYNTSRGWQSPLNLGFLFLLSIYYFALIKAFFENKDDSFYDKVIIFSIKMIGIGFFVLFALSFSNVLSKRMSDYFHFSFVIVLPYVFLSVKKYYLGMIALLVFLTYSLYRKHSLLLNFDYFS